jgi:hypothetical protein
MQDIQSLDRNMATTQPGSDLLWFDIKDLGVEGRGFTDTAEFYDRLPARAKGVVPDPVWQLSQHSAGMCVRFITDSKSISADWTIRYESLAMDHMPAAGVSGLDLYVLDGQRWRWQGVGRNPQFPRTTRALVGDMVPGRRLYMLYLPLYNGVTSVKIGIDPGATISKAPAWEHKPIVFYGTSIVHGGCASRTGMAYPAILGRKLNRPHINLGFSGNGKMHFPVAELLAELDASVFVFDCLPNLTEPMITERATPFVRIIRKRHTTTPIVLVESIRYQGSHHIESQAQRIAVSNAALHKAYETLLGEGVKNLHYFKGDALLGDDDEGTVDGSHPTDLGFMRMAEAFEPVLRKLV